MTSACGWSGASRLRGERSPDQVRCRAGLDLRNRVGGVGDRDLFSARFHGFVVHYSAERRRGRGAWIGGRVSRDAAADSSGICGPVVRFDDGLRDSDYRGMQAAGGFGRGGGGVGCGHSSSCGTAIIWADLDVGGDERYRICALGLSNAPGLRALGLFVGAATICIWGITFLVLPAYLGPWILPKNRTSPVTDPVRNFSTKRVFFWIGGAGLSGDDSLARFGRAACAIQHRSTQARWFVLVLDGGRASLFPRVG